MATLQINRETPKTRLVTMGQQDREIEYEEYYPPGTTEPILREKQPNSVPEPPAAEPEPLVEQEAALMSEPEPAEPEAEYGDGVRANEQGEKVMEFGTLNKKRKPGKKANAE